MTDFVDGEEAILVCCGSNNVCRQEKWPAEETGVSEEVCTQYLKADDAGADVLCEGLWAAELGDLFIHPISQAFYRIENSDERRAYLRMRLNNSHSPRSMRLLGIRPEEMLIALLRLLLSIHLHLADGELLGAGSQFNTS